MFTRFIDSLGRSWLHKSVVNNFHHRSFSYYWKIMAGDELGIIAHHKWQVYQYFYQVTFNAFLLNLITNAVGNYTCSCIVILNYDMRHNLLMLSHSTLAVSVCSLHEFFSLTICADLLPWSLRRPNLHLLYTPRFPLSYQLSVLLIVPIFDKSHVVHRATTDSLLIKHDRQLIPLADHKFCWWIHFPVSFACITSYHKQGTFYL